MTEPGEGQDGAVLQADDDPVPVKPCAVCEMHVAVDGVQAVKHWGRIICEDCAEKPVAFEAECLNQFCDWSVREEWREFERGAVLQLVQNEANSHSKWRRVIDDDPMHKTVVREVEPDV